MKQTLVFVAVLIIAVAIYWPILKKARTDISARSAAGLGNGLLFAVLLIPLFGPIIYLLVRSRFQVK
jgi:hypothetical protein